MIGALCAVAGLIGIVVLAHAAVGEWTAGPGAAAVGMGLAAVWALVHLVED